MYINPRLTTDTAYITLRLTSLGSLSHSVVDSDILIRELDILPIDDSFNLDKVSGVVYF